MAKAKDIARVKLLDYLGNPDNEWLSYDRLSREVLGYSGRGRIHQLFSADERTAIEAEALDIRRKKYCALLAPADKGLLKRASEGDPAAVKLAYQRFENWSEKIRQENSGSQEIVIKTEIPEPA